ncbi:TPA: mechanosensitive ion channel, partial [Candidatus Woesearchaeota archaeon]|nr:mechanosensitive ion channel [Candidatus Woesearchaeota archaeon]
NYLETEVEIEERIFLAKVYTIFLYVMGIAIILWKVGVSLTSLTLFLGLVTSAIAFGIRDVILSAVAWLIIINKKPFRIGDVIRVGDDIGQVTRIGTFFSTLEPLRGAGQFIKIPNRILLEKNMINMGQKRVVHKAKIMLAKVPKQSGQRMKKILAVIKKYTQDIEEKDRAIAVIESDQNGWYVWLSFPLPLGEEEKRSLILAEAYEILKDCVKK